MHAMTRVLSIILLGLLAAVVLAAAVALLLPSAAHVERSIVVDAPQATVFALANGFERFPDWSPWHDADPDISYSLEGPSHGVGATMTWSSQLEAVGTGRQRIVESEPYRLVRYLYEFGDRGTSEAAIVVEPADSRSRVSWSLDTEFGWNLVARFFGLAFDRMVGPDLEEGLERLKALAEGLPGDDWSDIQISVQELAPVALAVTAGQAGPGSEVEAAALAEAYGRVDGYLRRSGLEPAGPPVAITRDRDPEVGWSFFAGVPIAEVPQVLPDRDAPVRIGQTPEGLTVVAIHPGSRNRITDTVAKTEAFIAAHGFERAGPQWEQYLDDPATTPADRLTTRVCMPVR